MKSNWVNNLGYLPVIALLAGIFFLGAVAPAIASGDGHGDTEELKHRVDLEGKSGFNLYLARTYNDNRPLYALLVTAIMAVLGIAVGQITGLVLRLIGVR
jgi:hypothetical protein